MKLTTDHTGCYTGIPPYPVYFDFTLSSGRLTLNRHGGPNRHKVVGTQGVRLLNSKGSRSVSKYFCKKARKRFPSTCQKKLTKLLCHPQWSFPQQAQSPENPGPSSPDREKQFLPGEEPRGQVDNAERVWEQHDEAGEPNGGGKEAAAGCLQQDQMWTCVGDFCLLEQGGTLPL